MVKLRCKYTFVKVRKCERLESIDIQKRTVFFGQSVRVGPPFPSFFTQESTYYTKCLPQ